MRTLLRVLHIEDSVDDTIMLLRALRESGYEPLWERVDTAAATAAALERHPWDIVISDYALPHYDAFDALRIFQERKLDLPFFIVSGQMSEANVVTAMRAGAHDYFMKDRLARLGPAIERELRAARLRSAQRRFRQALYGSAENVDSPLPPASDLMPLFADDTVASFNPLNSTMPGAFPAQAQTPNFFAELTDIGELRQAIEQDQLFLHYQPQVNLKNDCAVRAEALVRWRHPHYGMVPPDRFIPLAEYTGLINLLSQWVLNAALQQCQGWRTQQFDVDVSVNFSMQDLQDPHIITIITTLLETWQMSPTQLTVEITESTLAAHPEQARAILAHLRTQGMRIAIDDFGTGYASLSALQHFPVDEIKLDKSFVCGLKTNARDAAIVGSSIDLGHRLGVQVVAEGVEDSETYSLLAALGCDLVQGYYVSRPLPAAGFSTWLQESTWSAQAA